MTTPTAAELKEKRARLSRWIPDGEPDAATQGMNHLAVFAKDLEATAAFYNDCWACRWFLLPITGMFPSRLT